MEAEGKERRSLPILERLRRAKPIESQEGLDPPPTEGPPEEDSGDSSFEDAEAVAQILARIEAARAPPRPPEPEPQEPSGLSVAELLESRSRTRALVGRRTPRLAPEVPRGPLKLLV